MRQPQGACSDIFLGFWKAEHMGGPVLDALWIINKDQGKRIAS